MKRLNGTAIGTKARGNRGTVRSYNRVTDEKIKKMMEISFQERTEAKIKWALNCYNQWHEMHLDAADCESQIF